MNMALLPRLGALPSGMVKVAGALLVSAVLILLPTSLPPWEHYPGYDNFPDLPGTVQNHWLLHTLGLMGMTHSSMQMYPATIDLVVLNGFPLDAIASWPLAALLGWPAGFVVFNLLTLWAVGLSSAWLAGRWWGSLQAALVAGIAHQVAAPLLRELAYGRSTQVFGAIFAPLALGLLLEAMTTGRSTRAVGAGVMLALSTLTYWFFGFFYGLGLLTVIVLAGIERLPKTPQMSCIFAISCLTILVLPMGYTAEGLSNQAGLEASLWSVVDHGSESIPLATLLEHRDLTNNLSQGIVGLTPLWWLLAGLGLAGRPRRWLVLGLWTGLGLLLAAGPWLTLPGEFLLPGPFALVPDVPLLRRLWWPDRGLFLMMPAVAVLAGGGAAALSRRWWWAGWAVGPLLIVEAFVALPNLPMPTTSGTPSERVKALSAGTGPVLVLPQGSTKFKLAHRILLDQIHHGRPLVNGTMPPDSETAPQAFQRISSLLVLQHLYACAEGGEPFRFSDARDDALEPLWRFGVSEVHVDTGIFAGMETTLANYLVCVESLLGEPIEIRGPHRVYGLD
ncbi:MAG: hypothetical protein P8R54_32325 [Myxococcota bacterium]|nr:hypothetical protein [Myxococcota bacterium]